MTSEQFCFWLQGFFEMTDSKNLTEAQVKMIKEHLALVFNKVTPPLAKGSILKDGLDRKAIEDLIRESERKTKPWSGTRATRYC